MLTSTPLTCKSVVSAKRKFLIEKNSENGDDKINSLLADCVGDGWMVGDKKPCNSDWIGRPPYNNLFQTWEVQIKSIHDIDIYTKPQLAFVIFVVYSGRWDKNQINEMRKKCLYIYEVTCHYAIIHFSNCIYCITAHILCNIKLEFAILPMWVECI